MRSNVPVPGNPWPHDMVINVDPHSHLLTLLFVRHVWGLARALDIPELDPVPEVGSSAMPPGTSRDPWSRRWERVWDRAWAWFGTDEPVPRWETEHGRGGLDLDALHRWEVAVRGPLPPPTSPEHLCVDALVPAWRAGVDSIVVLPYRGYYVRRLSRRHLAVSKATRDEPEHYRRALATVI